MADFEDLDRLAETVIAILPDRKAFSRLEPIRQSGYLLVKWQNYELAVKLSGESFELKGAELHLTAFSRLLTSELVTHRRRKAVLSAVVESLREAEGLVANQQEKALTLLASIKLPLKRLLGPKG